MKITFITILLLIVSVVGYSQFAPIVPMGSPSTENRATGALGTLTGMVYDKNWSDTGAANANLFVKNTPGIVIRVADVEYWSRNQTVNLWTKISGSGGGGFTTGDNGLTASSATNLQWGGSLLQNTSITSTAFTETHAYTNMGANAGFNLTQTGTASGSTNTLFKATQSGSTGIGQTTYTMDLYNLRTGTGGSNVTLRLNNTGKTSRFSLLVPTGFSAFGDEVIPVSKLDLVVAGLGATPHDTASFQIYNTTLATAAVPVQVSPSVWLYGNAWDSNGLVSKTPTFKFWSIPESRSGNVRGSLRFFYNPNATFGGFDTAVFSINSKGGIGLGINSNYGTANQVLVSGGATGEASWINQSSIVGVNIYNSDGSLTGSRVVNGTGAFFDLQFINTGAFAVSANTSIGFTRGTNRTISMDASTGVRISDPDSVKLWTGSNANAFFKVLPTTNLSKGAISFDGTTSSFPMIVSNGADLAVRLADNSAGANIQVLGVKALSTTFNLATTNATLINIGGANAAVVSFSGGTSSGKIRILEPSGSGTNYMEWSVPALAGNVSNVWPNANGSGVLTNDGSGNLSWAAASGGWATTTATTTFTGNPSIDLDAFNLTFKSSTYTHGLFNIASGGTIDIGDFHPDANGNYIRVDDQNDLAYYTNAAFTGKFGINVLVPTANIDLRGNVNFNANGIGTDNIIKSDFNTLIGDADGTTYIQINGSNSGNNITIKGATTVDVLSGTGTRAVLADASGVLSAPISDLRLKKSVINISDQIDVLGLLKDDSRRGILYNWIDPKRGTAQEIGFGAQMFEDIPGMTGSMKNTGYKYINYERMTALLWEQNRLLLQRIEALEKQINK